MNPLKRYLRKQRKRKEHAQIKALWEDYWSPENVAAREMETWDALFRVQETAYTLQLQRVGALWGQKPTTDR